MCSPVAQPPEVCPGNIPCPACGQLTCPCPDPTPPPPPRFPIGVTAQYELPLTDQPSNLTFTRSYMLHLPESYEPSRVPGRVPVPLVLYYHMQMNNAADDIANYNFTQMADANGFAVSLPQGIGPEDATAASCSTVSCFHLVSP